MKRTLTNPAILLASTLLSIGVAEGVLRLAGHRPWTYIVHDNEPTMHEPDATLGWRNKEGRYEFPAYAFKKRTITTTFLAGGLRRTHETQGNTRDARPKLIFAGGSFTQGFGLSDHRTFPWRVQRKFPGYEVLNYGTGGYGTYQTLLALERALPTLEDPRIVVYGFMAHHQNRNVAPSAWLEALSRYSNRSHVHLPYATLDFDGELVRHPPEAYPTLPLREHLALINTLGQYYMGLETQSRKRQPAPVTEQILRRMQQLTQDHDAQLVIALLQANDKTRARYEGFAADQEIPLIDCTFKLTHDLRIKREGHPNGKANARWAKCLVDGLRQQEATARPGAGVAHPRQHRQAHQDLSR